MLDPRTATQETVRALELVAQAARTYLETLPSGPVRTETSDLSAKGFDEPLPEDGDGALETIARLLADGPDAHVRSSGPRFFHWVIGGVTPAALAADWTASLIDQNAGGWSASPLGTELERVSLGWLRDVFGLPGHWSGVLTTGATMANFAGLAAARQWWGERHGIDVAEEGLPGSEPIPVLTSGFIHVTAVKALSMLGIGRRSVRRFEADATGRLDLGELEHALRNHRGRPAILIGNAGEVNAGHFDPLEALADLAAEYGAWLHVDGAFGLFARASPRTSELAAGVERADSVISDGHKWLNVPYDCGFAFVRDPALLAASFRAEADYLPESDDDRPIFGFLGPELSRRARSLAVWATLKAYGRRGVREIVERCLDNAAHVARLVQDEDDLELLAPAPLNVVCFRYRPEGLDEAELDELNLRIADAVLTDGRVYVGTTRWAGRVAFRPAFVNWRTTREDAELMLETVRELGTRLAARV